MPRHLLIKKSLSESQHVGEDGRGDEVVL